VRWEAVCVLFLGVIHCIGRTAGVAPWQGLCMDHSKPCPSWERVNTASRADHDYRGKNGVWDGHWAKYLNLRKDEGWRKSYSFLLVSLVPTHCRCRGLLSIWSLTWTHTHTHSVWLPWTRDQPVPETSTCTTHNIHKRKISMPPAGFEATIPASQWPQAYALDHAGTRIGEIV
jgi:hypothetical protein